MKLRYLSDLHLEFIKPNNIQKFIKEIPPGLDEICILAGDIGNPYSSNYDLFMKFINDNFKRSFVIPGNHEYYNQIKTIEQTNEFLLEYFQKHENIRFLNNDFERYEDHCFIGTTLWSKISNPKYEINDVYSIPNFDYIHYNKLNEQCIQFLENTVNTNDHCIVITHHLPSFTLIDKKYKTYNSAPYNQWFYCDMDVFIQKNKDKLKCWFYGHTHTPANTTINGVPLLCNPIGYPGENSKLKFDSVFEI